MESYFWVLLLTQKCMNSQQEKRYAKLRTERFYLLDRSVRDENLQFHISGSTRNVYTVTVYPNSASVFCSCPDARSWAKKHKCVCKHCLFILYRVLKVFDRTDHPFFDRLWFTPEELECIQLSTEYLQAHLDNTVVDRHLSHRYTSIGTATTQNDYTPTIRFDADDLCGVCFLELENDHADQCMACPTCKKSAHKDCIEKWISSGQQLCVYCRQDVWGDVKTLATNGNYKNLGY